jgi:hypothetical protein
MDITAEQLHSLVFCVSVEKRGFIVQGHRFEDDSKEKAAFVHMLRMVIANLTGENEDDHEETVYDEDGNELGTATLIGMNSDDETLN